MAREPLALFLLVIALFFVTISCEREALYLLGSFEQQ